jgi:hypothetical protein
MEIINNPQLQETGVDNSDTLYLPNVKDEDNSK